MTDQPPSGTLVLVLLLGVAAVAGSIILLGASGKARREVMANREPVQMDRLPLPAPIDAAPPRPGPLFEPAMRAAPAQVPPPPAGAVTLQPPPVAPASPDDPAFRAEAIEKRLEVIDEQLMRIREQMGASGLQQEEARRQMGQLLRERSGLARRARERGLPVVPFVPGQVRGIRPDVEDPAAPPRR